MRRLTLAILTAAAAAVLVGGAAAAHANYVKSNPASDARLTKPPTEVRVSFSEPPDPKGSALEVLDAAGKRFDKNDVTAVTDEANTLRVSLGLIGDGGYLVSWTAVSVVDGHQTKGAFAFAVGNAPLPTIPAIGPSAPPPTPLEVIGRALSYMGMAAVVGTAFFGLFLRMPREPPERRRERWLLAGGAAALVVGAGLLLVQYGANIPARLQALLALRALAGAIVLAMLWIPDRVVPMDARREVVAFAGLAAGLTATLVSHAAASGELKNVALDYLHVVAVSVWTGGVVALLAVVLPHPTVSEAERRALGATVWRFSLTALVAVSVIVTTGTLQSLDRLVLVEDLFETPYGLALLAKIVLLAVTLAFGATNLLVWGPRLRRGIAARRQLAQSTVAETALFACVLVAAAYLTSFAPPAQGSAAAFAETHRVSGVRVELLAAQRIPGRNRFVIRVQQGLAPVTNAEKVALRFTMVEHDMGEQELVAAQRAPGEYVAEGSPTAMFGTWRVDTIVRLPGREDLRTVFTFPIGAPSTGTGATAKVISAPPYTIIVFADPFQPQAGAPVVVNAVVVNEKGDPVTGKKVRATFSGPSPQAAIDAVENAAQLGAGRYQISIPGLAAGTWEVTIDVNGEATGVYGLDVIR